MPPASAALAESASSAPTGAQADRVRELQERIRGMQRTTLETTALPTLEALGDVLPGGALQAGTSYEVAGSMALVMAMLAGPSGEGSWCGVVGAPEFGLEAAAGFGVDLERLVMVPDPGDQWMAVTAALADVLTVVVTRPTGRVRDSDAARLAARLRQNGSVLITLGDWPGSDTRLQVTASEWSGVGAGHGYPSAHRVTLEVSGRGIAGRPRTRRVLLPAAAAGVSTAPRHLEAVESGPAPPLVEVSTPVEEGAQRPSRDRSARERPVRDSPSCERPSRDRPSRDRRGIV